MLDLIPTFIGCQFYAPWLVLDLPSIRRINVLRVQHRPRELSDLIMGWGHAQPPEEQPERLLIDYAIPGACSGQQPLGTLAIDLEQEVIDVIDWGSLVGYEHLGSAGIGVALFGLPGLLLTSPLLVLAGLIHRVIHWTTGMDWHTLSVWLRIRNQLPKEFRGRVRRAFVNRHNGTEEAWREHQRAVYDARQHELDDLEWTESEEPFEALERMETQRIRAVTDDQKRRTLHFSEGQELLDRMNRSSCDGVSLDID